MQDQHQVIIIGAGMSGITAAHTLHSHGISCVILESSLQIGGRIKSTLFEQQTIEEGANWIQGVSQKNPIWQLANKVGLQTQECKRRRVPHGYLEEEERLERMIGKIQEKGSQKDVSVQEALGQMGWEPETAMQKLAQFAVLDLEYADNISELSTFHNILEEFTLQDYGPKELFVKDQRGFSVILQQMAHKLDIRNGQTVTQIKYGPEEGVVVKTNENEYQGKCVILTVSIGVLQKNHIEFQPKIPDWKTSAISKVKMAVFCKIFMKFPHKFWDDQEILFDKGNFPFWKPISEEVIFTVVVGEEARRIERMDEQEVRKEVRECLQENFGREMQEPSSIHVCKWHTDTRFHGSYSFLPVGFNSQEDLMRPVESIFFAGEAYDERYSGYVHGAYRSGITTANQVIQKYFS